MHLFILLARKKIRVCQDCLYNSLESLLFSFFTISKMRTQSIYILIPTKKNVINKSKPALTFFLFLEEFFVGSGFSIPSSFASSFSSSSSGIREYLVPPGCMKQSFAKWPVEKKQRLEREELPSSAGGCLPEAPDTAHCFKDITEFIRVAFLPPQGGNAHSARARRAAGVRAAGDTGAALEKEKIQASRLVLPSLYNGAY